MREHGITAKELATSAGCTPRTIDNLVTGHVREPKLGLAVKIAVEIFDRHPERDFDTSGLWLLTGKR
jgi:DNA-binding XRE family transcriptional regulator